MADVINKTTLEFRPSVNTPSFPTADWLINPDMSGVRGVPKKYWKLRGTAVVEMNATEKAAVDAAEAGRDKTEPIIARSRDGSLWKITVSDAGVLAAPTRG